MNITMTIPTYIERDNLQLLVPDVLSRGDYRVLVVDDDSPDGTGEVADALALKHPGRVEVLHRRGPRGLGLSVTDCTSGFRCWRRDTLCQLPLEHIVSNGYAFLVETLFEAACTGARIGEVPIVFVAGRDARSCPSKYWWNQSCCRGGCGSEARSRVTGTT